jgi:dihydroorotate dehydrogenase
VTSCPWPFGHGEPVDWYSRVIRPALFSLSPDRAHDLAQLGLRWSSPWTLVGRRSWVEDARLRTDLAGLALENPVGLAPGFDKNGHLIPSLDKLGFGYLVIGSVTRAPRPGNPKPRLTRYPERRSLGNNLGLPSRGLDHVRRALASIGRPRGKVVVSVTGFSDEELLDAAAAVEPLVDAVELGLVCPNTTESQRMAGLEVFTRVSEVIARRKRKPVFIRLTPHHNDAERELTMAMLDVCIALGIDGVSINGRRRIADPKLPNGEGSISGRATFDDALRITRDVASHSGGRLAIRASGGIFTGDDAAAMLRAGATTVEVYTSLIYQGPSTARLLNHQLLEALDQMGLPDVDALRGAAGAQRTRSTTQPPSPEEGT